MADELTLVTQFTYTNPERGVTIAFPSQTKRVSVSGSGGYHGTMSIGTTAETPTFTDIGTQGYAYVRNLDHRNFLYVGDGDGFIFQLLPGEDTGLFRMRPSTLLRMQADVAAVLAEVVMIPD